MFCFNFRFNLIRSLNDVTKSFQRENKLFKRDICCFDFRSYFLVLISILLDFGQGRERIFKTVAFWDLLIAFMD